MIKRAHPLIQHALEEVNTLFSSGDKSNPYAVIAALSRIRAEFPNIILVEEILMDWREQYYWIANKYDIARDLQQKGGINPRKVSSLDLQTLGHAIEILERVKSRVDQLEPPSHPKDRIEIIFDLASAYVLRGAFRIYNWSGRFQDFRFAEEYLEEARALSQKTEDYFEPRLSQLRVQLEELIKVDQSEFRLPRNPDQSGLEESVREQIDGFRSAIDTRGVVVLGESLTKWFPGLRVMAGLEEDLVIDRGNPAETAIHLAERGVTHVQYFGGLEEAQHFEAAANPLQIGVTAHTQKKDPRFRSLLGEILSNLGVSPERIAGGLEQFAHDLEELGLRIEA